MDAQNYIRCVCEGCNTEFEAVRPKRYCTRKCNKAAIRKNKTSVSRAEYVANMRENAASKFTCECCGIEAFRTMSGTNKAKGFVNRWCSMICRSAAAAQAEARQATVAKEIAALLRETYGSKIKVFGTEIPHSVRAKEISAEGKSIFAHDPNGKVAEGYKNLTQEVIKLEKQREKSRAGSIR